MKKTIKEIIWKAKNEFIKNVNGLKEPEILIINISDFHRLKDECDNHEIIDLEGKQKSLFGLDIIVRKNIEPGKFLIR